MGAENRVVDCADCRYMYDCERTYLGGCTDGEKWEVKKNMIDVEGLISFVGFMKITPKGGVIAPFEIYGDWLYKPEHDCWYCGGSSYPACICEIVKDETEKGD